MKISKKRLQRIIKEELEMAYSGPKMDRNNHEYDRDSENIGAKEQLLTLATDALGLYCALEDDHELESWVEAKISMANDYVSKAKRHLGGELQLEIPIPDMQKAIESTKKEPELPESTNYAGQGSYYYEP
jgi:hypothetical protein